MIAPPGAGKSTYVKNELSSSYILSRDLIRAELGFCKNGEKIVGTTEQECKVHATWKFRLEDALRKGIDIVIDDTNCVTKGVRDIFSIAKSINPEIPITLVRLHTPLEVIIKVREEFISSDAQKRLHHMAESINLKEIVEKYYPSAIIKEINTKWWKK